MLPKRNFSESSVSLEIDLEKMFGKKIADPGLRRNIAESLIDIILKRTESGYGVAGNGAEVKLKSPYSKMYTESAEFMAFDKSKTHVNMKLTGSMLASVDLIKDRANVIEIGIDNEDAAKAYNHLVGDTVPRRPWLGLTSSDIEEVKAEYKSEIKKDEPVTVKDIFTQSNLSRLANIVSNRNLIGFKK